MVVRRAMPVITAAVHSVEAPSKHHLWESDECRSTRDAFQHCENFEIVARFDIVARILREREREIRDYLGALLAEARNCSASERSQDRRVPLCRDFARGCSAVNHGREFTARTRAITIANCRSTVIKTANRTIRAYYDWRWTRIAVLLDRETMLHARFRPIRVQPLLLCALRLLFFVHSILNFPFLPLSSFVSTLWKVFGESTIRL